jgi:glycosyltransferase involved in cell wall biosynthesis
MKIVMLANNPCIYDARIRREAEALSDAGHRVTVLATSSDAAPERETVAGVDYRRIFKVREIKKSLDAEAAVETGTAGRWPRRLKGTAFHIGRNLITPSVRHLVGYARAYRQTIKALDPDVVHAHDLDTLLAGWLGAKAARAKLVYDAHELETDRNLPMVRHEKRYRAFAERWLVQRSDAVITVSDSIADYLAERYQIDRPTVLLNAPTTRMAVGGTTMSDLRADLGLSPDQPLALYVGGLMPGRGIDQAIRALGHAPNVQLAAVGPRQEASEQEMTALAETLGVRERLHLVDPVPPERLGRYIASADVSLILLQNSCLNHLFCFPNKLLQSLLAGLPVVVSRLVELERMVALTGAGLVVDETNPTSIAQAITAILAEPGRYRPSPSLIGSLQASHGWKAQKERLLTCYHRLDHLDVPGFADARPAPTGTPMLSGGPPR